MVETLSGARNRSEVLEQLARLALHVVPEVDHASITVSEADGLTTVAATGDVPRTIDRIQYELGEGPCVSATRTRETVLVPDVVHDARWPGFTARVSREHAVCSMLAIPLGGGGEFTASLNLVASTTPFTAAHAASGLVLVSLASLALTAAQERQRADEMAARMRELEDFTAALSHDLRNGVGAALTAAEALARRQSQLDFSGQRALTLLSEELSCQSRLLLDLLELARARNVPLPPVALLPVVRDAVRQHQGQVRLRLDQATDAVLVAIHPVRLRQIVANLLSNADRHGGGATGVEVGRTGNRAWVAVDDAGPGVPAEQREYVFKRFRTASTSMAAGGTGLGLALSREHARSAGGELLVEPLEGHGARFLLQLPVVNSPDDVLFAGGREQAAPTSSRRKPVATPVRSAPPMPLIVPPRTSGTARGQTPASTSSDASARARPGLLPSEASSSHGRRDSVPTAARAARCCAGATPPLHTPPTPLSAALARCATHGAGTAAL